MSDITIDLDNKTATKTIDKHLSNFIDNLSNMFSGNSDGNRDDWVKNVHKHYVKSFPGHGIMVIHKGQKQISASSNSYKHFHLEYRKTFGTEGFEIYVIKKGSGTIITNTGDGGYTNWCFSGYSNRDGKIVTF